MNRVFLNFAFGLFIAISQPTMVQAQVTLFFEDFEDASIGYTVSTADDLTNIANERYFGRIDGGVTLPSDIMYFGLQGAGFYGAQDTDDANSGDIDLITMDVTSIDITNFESLTFSILVAEDDAEDANEDWDPTTSFRISYQVDGGGYFPLFAVEGESDVSGNRAPRIDTDFDGVGDGAAMTPTFTSYVLGLGGATGNSLDLRFEIEDLDTGDEDIAFDNILLTGVNSIPEPSTFGFIAILGTLVLCRKRRKA